MLKPKTFMNDSGRALGSAVRYYKTRPGAVTIFYDELDLTPGKVRVKLGGGHAGHNGIRSISSHIGQDFRRVRIGIGHPGSKDEVTNWVLNKFTPNEKKQLIESYSKFVEVFELITSKKIQEAQKLLHTK